MEPRVLTPHSQGFSWAESIQFLILIPISSRSIQILTSHLHLGILKVSFLYVYLLTFWNNSYLLPFCLHDLLASNLLDLITLSMLGSSLWSLVHFPFASLLVQNILLRILFSNAFNLHFSLNVRNHPSQPYITTGNIIVLYILVFIFLERSLEDKTFRTYMILIFYNISINLISIILGLSLLFFFLIMIFFFT